MKSIVFSLLFLLGNHVFADSTAGSASHSHHHHGSHNLRSESFSYPPARRDESQVDVYFGTKVPDPYRWLEDPDSPETVEFVDGQNNLTTPYLLKAEGRDIIEKKLNDIYNHDSFGTPTKRNNYYFFFDKRGLQNQQILYVQEGLNGSPRVLLDPNSFAADGTVSITAGEPSRDGEIYAYGLSAKGSDWVTIHFRNVSTGQDFPEILKQSKWPGMEWTHDNLGVFYSRYPDANETADGSETTVNENLKIYYHYIGTPQSEDKLVVEFPEHPRRTVGVEITHDQKYLLVAVQENLLHNLVYYTRMDSLLESRFRTKPVLTPIISEFNGEYSYVTSKDSEVLYFQTNKGAPNFRVVGIYLENPDEKYWSVLIPENPTDVLNSVHPINNDQLVTEYMHDVKSILQLRRLSDGSLLKDFALEVGAVQTFTGQRHDSQFFFRFESFLTPGRIYLVDLAETRAEAVEPKLFREVKITGFDASKFVTSQVFYESKDGTKVPMFIVHPKDLKLDGSAPALLYGYGGFSISLQPSFSESRLAFIQLFGGVLAIANIRGGGEYGAKWHDGGRVLNKQNGFDDFQAAAQYLVDKKYTTTSKLTIQGGSNGGLLVGACVNQRPDLFGAAVAQVGVMDMLRYHKFTIGHAWASDYGTSDDKVNFDNLIQYSPVHTVRVPKDPNVQYPAVLVTTGDHDDRVVPLHSYKFIAELQHTVGKSPNQKNPLLILIEKNAGHGAGKPTTKKIRELTDMYSFMIQSLGLHLVK